MIGMTAKSAVKTSSLREWLLPALAAALVIQPRSGRTGGVEAMNAVGVVAAGVLLIA